MPAKHWMDEAFANSHGQFKAKAKRAGMSTMEYAKHVHSNPSHFDRRTVKQATLAMTGMRMAHRR